MIIPEYARHNFDPKDTDDKLTAINKLYYLSNDKIARQMLTEQEQKEFDRKYNEIMRLKKDKTAKGQLELQQAIEEFLEENK